MEATRRSDQLCGGNSVVDAAGPAIREGGMRGLIFILTIVYLLTGIAAAQAGPARDIEGEQRRARVEAFNQAVDRLRNLEKLPKRVDPNADFVVYTSRIRPLYLRPTKAETEMLAPAEEDVRAAGAEVGTKDSGVVKLIADRECSKDIFVTAAGAHCEKYSMPGAGSAYSFRIGSHWLRHLSDINFNGKGFEAARGELTNGIIVDIGDAALEKIGRDNRVFATLDGFSAPGNFDKAANLAGLLESGIRDGDVVYKDSAAVRRGSTYLLRSIAYRAESIRVIDEVPYDEFAFDVRKDVLVAFRVIRYEPGESVTIAWRMLHKRDSPRLSK